MRVQTHGLGWSAGALPVLHDVDVDLEPGVMTAVVGPNGSGKTTLLHLLGGLRRASAGTVAHDGVEVARIRPRERARRIALVEQHPDTGLDVTVRHVVGLGRIPHAGRWPGSRDPDPGAVAEAMAATDVASLADRGWSTLSGGERQRTHLARALAQRPRLLLLDEPTNHLDLRHQIDLLDLVSRLGPALGLSTVAVLHDLDLAAAFCPRIVVMSRGRVAGQGPTQDVLTADLIADVFGVEARVDHDDRVRVRWSGLVSRT